MSSSMGSFSPSMAPTAKTRRRPSCPTLGSTSSAFTSILHPPSSSLPRKRRPTISDSQNHTLLVQWVLDTRPLWPSALRTIHLTTHAHRALALLPAKDRDDVLRYVHVKDAKMALGSRLLKRYLITRYAEIPWDQAVTTRNADTKPVFQAPDGSEPIAFNVSHQAGLVVLIAALHPAPGAALGVDVVCPAERRDRDHALIRAEGWGSFVDIHGEVLCPAEVTGLHNLPFRNLDHRLRYFYTLWCLREAYVKMTGEALLASWLNSLEMRYFAPPEDTPIEETEIWFQGNRLEDVDLHLVNVLDGFMICTSTHRDSGGGRLEVGQYELLDIEDAISFGEKSRAASVVGRTMVHR